MRRGSSGLAPFDGAAATQVMHHHQKSCSAPALPVCAPALVLASLTVPTSRSRTQGELPGVQVMQRFADSVRVQSLVQSERSLCYDLLLLAIEVRGASSCIWRNRVISPKRCGF